jgi:FixJ family two-component response regulator
MTQNNAKIFIVDDDESVRRSLSLLLTAAGYTVESFADSDGFLANGTYPGTGCILLDIFLNGRSGLEIQQEIRDTFKHLPIIYITGYGDIPMSVLALKKGAINFLRKPVDELQLIDSVEEALQASREVITLMTESEQVKALFQKLSPREMDVFRLVLTGKLNKQIASDLNIAEQTVKIHRGNITKKIGVKSVAELVRLAEKAGLL